MGLFTRSVDSIVANITTQIDRLGQAVAHHTTQGDNHLQISEDAKAAAADHFSEAERASKIAAKLHDLIS
jgi:hypothetical protein